MLSMGPSFVPLAENMSSNFNILVIPGRSESYEQSMYKDLHYDRSENPLRTSL